MSPLVWAACACYIWPLSPLHAAHRCGRCGTYPLTPVKAPADGKARPLSATERRRVWASEMSDAERAAWAAVDWTVEP